METLKQTFTAFSGSDRITTGDIKDVATEVKEHLKKETRTTVLIFNDLTGEQVDIDLRGTAESLAKRLEGLFPSEEAEAEVVKGPGRPKLGVVPREVTLLPAQWDWLSRQPGGASVTLRKLVEEARKKNFAKDQIRMSQDATYKFMHVMAGDLPNYEEALRALYAKDKEKFAKQISGWPKDVRDHAKKLAKSAFAD
ncbi:DUF2239 family protein [Bdellovibrio sp. NC01]|uniref:DUF2239 family protein n=1 Tax=Bdellovibrio sp. NC01 TaxID=2220073 RepID=UPI00115ACDFE|nr:DUF2239 family protein [Bdellovibrio sp. NC01]QDK39313.1 DUF2239 domain-containing protein [Bdellovibrio sp. NC01]